MKKNLKRMLSLLLACAAALSFTASPSHASQFWDVSDKQTAQAADVLSALGVVSGTDEGRFSPSGHLTRAQLCKMAVEILGLGNAAQAQAYRTIFTDMGGGHWARGYVNLAAITEIPENSGSRLMLGLGNGTFGPDLEVTYQEAATLALRILGYSAEANRSWPFGAIETAARLGLDRDLMVEIPSAPITRGQTALLFFHLLSTPSKGSSEPYASKLGTLVEDTIILSTNASINGREGWVVATKDGATTTYPTAVPADSSQRGQRGWALLDQEGRFVTLLPDESSYITDTVSRKQAYYLYLSGESRYTLDADTPVYTGSAYDAKVTTYKEYMASLRVGDTVTLYLDSEGRVAGLYRPEASPEGGCVVVKGNYVGYETFFAITGGARDFTIRKNGASISMRDIKPYDVATYDPITKVLDVCDVRLACFLENASPAPNAPTKITAAGGNQFDVMYDAIGDFTGRRIGESITLLLTSNGKVAGLLPQISSATASNALGVLSADGKKFELLGCQLTLDVSGDLPDGVTQGEILSASSTERGVLTLKAAGSKTAETFDTAHMTLGFLQVSPGVRIYERTPEGLVSKELSDLPPTVTALQYHRGGSGKVDLIILNTFSASGKEYGRIDEVSGYMVKQVSGAGKDEEGNIEQAKWMLVMVQQLMFTGKDGSKTYDVGGRSFASGYGYLGEYNGVVNANYLDAVPDVSSSAFYTHDGITYVRTGKGIYPVADDVLCFNAAATYAPPSTRPAWVNIAMNKGGVWEGEWDGPVDEAWYPEKPNVSVFGSLGECRNFSDTVTIYLDQGTQTVRVVEAS